MLTVPRIAITLRKNYGQAYLNMAGGRNSDEAAAWPTADFGFMDQLTGQETYLQTPHLDAMAQLGSGLFGQPGVGAAHGYVVDDAGGG